MHDARVRRQGAGIIMWSREKPQSSNDKVKVPAAGRSNLCVLE
jgi:hypothetical protein